jgi:hypothetical protein
MSQRFPNAGYGRGQPAPAPQPSAEALALRDARAEVAMLEPSR